MTRNEMRALRESVGLTQAALAALVGVHPVSVAKWECGMRKISTPHARFVRMLCERTKSENRK